MVRIETLQELTSKNCPSARGLQIHRSAFKATLIEDTFDPFHFGHRALLQTMFQFAKHVHITIMTDQGSSGKNNREEVASFNKRLTPLHNFLDEFSFSQASTLHKTPSLDDFGGNVTHAQEIDSIGIFSEEEGKRSTKKLNEKRREKALPPLTVLALPPILSLSGEELSSNKGKEVEKRADERVSFSSATLTDKLKPKIRKTKGKLVKSVDQLPHPPKHVVSIGDRVTKNLIRKGYPVSLAIIDQKVRRQKVSPLRLFYEKTKNGFKLPAYVPCVNPPGKITQQAWHTMKFAFMQKFPVVVKIYGEEDLLGIPATIMAPQGTLLLYGQPPILGEEGIVYFQVDWNDKKSAFNLLREMQDEGEDF